MRKARIALALLAACAGPCTAQGRLGVNVYGLSYHVEREEAHLRPIFGARYGEYCARVHRFIPGRPLEGQPVVYWNWTLFRQNNAGLNLMGTLAVWAAVAVWLLRS